MAKISYVYPSSATQFLSIGDLRPWGKPADYWESRTADENTDVVPRVASSR
jgi:hypothetical protein